MSTDLVPVDNMAALDAMDSQTRDLAVTNMLTEARAWLAHAVEATEPQAIANFKAQMATVAEATKQLGLSKEIQLDAQEMVRRAERGVGVAVKRGQERGTIRKLGDGGGIPTPGVRGSLSRESFPDDLDEKSSPNDYFAHAEEKVDSYVMASATDDQFEDAITEARAEGNISRANVVRKVRGETPKSTQRHEMLRGTRRIDGDRVIDATVLDAASLISPSLNAQIDFAELNRDKLGEWVSSLNESIKALRHLKNSLEKELHNG